MKKLLILFFMFILQFNSVIFAKTMPQQDVNMIEMEVAEQLIENYYNGVPETKIKVDLNIVSVRRIYLYVYSVIPERLNVKSNIKNQQLWIETRKNQNHEHSIQKAREIKKSILNENMTELEKITAIHDWIVFHTEFDTQTAKTATVINDENIYAFCANGVFVHKKAVCSGYAAAFKMMCQEANIPCFTINSRIKNHTWNVVYYDGAWRFIDVSRENRIKNPVNILSIYSYFMLNENELPQKTHQLDEFSKNTLGLNEYIAFYNHYKNKQHNSNAKSVHVDIMKQLAEKNNSYAMFELAKIYENGTYGIEKSEKDRFQWYDKAAVLGHTVAQNNVAYCYKNGIGIEKNEVLAFQWYQKAAEKGFHISQTQMGHFYRLGLGGVSKNMEIAKNWYEKAAEQGNTMAIDMLKKYF